MSRGAALAVVVAMAAVGCADHTPPAVATVAATNFEALVVPPGLRASAAVLDLHARASADLRAGRFREAAASFTEALRRASAFYPADAGLGDVALATGKYAEAIAHFDEALSKNTSYVPALAGRADASLASKDESAAIDALERLLAIEPGREDARNRLNVLRVRAVERELTVAKRARAANDLEGAHAAFARALAMSPSSAVILRGLADVELASGALDDAAAHARAAVAADATDAESWMSLGDVLVTQGLQADAVQAFTKAVALDPRPEWRARLESARGGASAVALPAEYLAIPTATAVTRAQVAAYIGNHLKDLVDRAPKRNAVVVTDVRSNWAAPWIFAVTAAGIMDALPNHTFQPAAAVTRTDLAKAVAGVLTIIAVSHPRDAAAWRTARPRFVDVPPEHLAYPAAALAVSAGAMTADGGRFAPTRPATGADLVAAVARLEKLAGS